MKNENKKNMEYITTPLLICDMNVVGQIAHLCWNSMTKNDLKCVFLYRTLQFIENNALCQQFLVTTGNIFTSVETLELCYPKEIRLLVVICEYMARKKLGDRCVLVLQQFQEKKKVIMHA